ncbi:hypothetical protein [Ruegeria sp. HKCCA5491]|uniref:hypothetical protein n=1 Tax=Ruegeria sp. HKCCA5491 TaxID=2682986 RepID=UPI001488A475|nr:hypothetical protein [Ruegeria sp. HKCCA5491]
MSKKWIELFGAVQQKTDTGELDWEWDQFSRTLEAPVGRRTVRLALSSAGDYTLSIRNDEGDTVDRFTDEDLKDVSNYHYTTQDFRQLYETARRIAFDADKEVDELLKDLRADDS